MLNDLIKVIPLESSRNGLNASFWIPSLLTIVLALNPSQALTLMFLDAVMMNNNFKIDNTE